MNPIGQIKTKTFAYCEVCGSKTTRNISVLIYQGTAAEKQDAMNEINARAKKPYTCKVCKSIKA